jgi:hypothetical protein
MRREREKRAMRRLVSSLAVVAALLVGFAPRAAAASISGTATGTGTTTNFQQRLIGRVGGDTYYYQTFTVVYSGDITGTASDTVITIVHSDETETAQEGSEICASCTVAGRTGGYAAEWNFIGSATTGAGGGAFIWTRGSGGLRGLVGGGTYYSPPSGVATFSYSYYLP